VVEGEDLIEEHEARVGDVEFVLGEGGEAFDLADDVVAEEADGPGGEGGKARQAGWGVAGKGGFEFIEDVASKGPALATFFNGDGVATGGDFLVGLDANEGIAADVLAAFYGFEEEGLGLRLSVALLGDAEEGGDRGFEVGGDGAVDRDEGVGAGEFAEVGGGGGGGFLG
jgi:hypothetical protein